MMGCWVVDQIDVFLSYAREDEAAAAHLAGQLQNEGLNVYWDRKLQYGGNYVQELDAQLDAAASVVVIWTNHSIASAFVQAEAMRGFNRQVLVPVLASSEIRPPTPFNVIQSAVMGRDGNSAGDWQGFVQRIKTLVAATEAHGLRTSASALSDTVRAARAAQQARVASFTDPLRRIAEGADVRQMEIGKALADALGRLSRDDLFSIAVVGRMKVGKSTLLNALLGPTSGVDVPPLPAEDLPCTATLIKLRHSAEAYCRPFAWDKQKNTIGDAMPDWGFQDFHRRARIYQDGTETNIFDQIAEFEVGWPSALLRSGVTLMDSPGISEAPERTELTRAAIATVDAAIVVYRSEPLAGTDEIEFAQEVTGRAGKVFTLVNLRGEHTMPPSQGLQNVVRTRLKLDTSRALDEQDVYFAHLKDGLRASYQNDRSLAVSSGLAPFQARLAEFLLADRYNAHLLKCLREARPIAENLSSLLGNLAIAADADVGRLSETIAACRQDLASIERKKSTIDSLFENGRGAIEIAAQRSFESKVAQMTNAMQSKLEGMDLGIDTALSRMDAVVRGKKFTEKAAEKINAVIRDELEQWSSADSDKEGLARDLKPAMDQLVGSLRAQADEIAETIQRIRGRIAALSPSVSASGSAVGAGEMAASVISATLLLGPLGVVGLGGWRGVVGAVGGMITTGAGVGLAVAILHIAFPPTALLTALGVAGGLLGAAVGAGQGIEKRIKKKAWEEIGPKLRGLAQEVDAKMALRASIGEWFNEMRSQLAKGLAQIIAIEQQNLARLDALSRESQNKVDLIARLKTYKAEADQIVSGLRTFEDETARSLSRLSSSNV